MAHTLLQQAFVDRGVIVTANELFECRHFPGVVAMCSDALDSEPECVPLLIMRARAHIALRRDRDAQADLRDIIRLDPTCGAAYRMLGVLAARRDENESAGIFFREALRLDADDRESADWLLIVDASVRPAAVAQKLPAPATAAGRFPLAISVRPPTQPPQPSKVPSARIAPRGPAPELPGFGEYLVTAGILTRERLRAAQAYQRSMKVQLGTAIVTLGLASPQRIEWAAVAHQSQIAQTARERQA